MKLVKLTYDVLRGINTTVWEASPTLKKTEKIIKTGLSGADVVIGTSHALEDLMTQSVGLLTAFEACPATVTGSITIGCRLVWYYCKQYGTFWCYIIAAGQGIKEAIKFKVRN